MKYEEYELTVPLRTSAGINLLYVMISFVSSSAAQTLATNKTTANTLTHFIVLNGFSYRAASTKSVTMYNNTVTFRLGKPMKSCPLYPHRHSTITSSPSRPPFHRPPEKAKWGNCNESYYAGWCYCVGSHFINSRAKIKIVHAKTWQCFRIETLSFWKQNKCNY